MGISGTTAKSRQRKFVPSSHQGRGVSADTLIIQTFLSAPACTDMVSSKELERDVTTNAMAKEPPRLKTLASFLHNT